MRLSLALVLATLIASPRLAAAETVIDYDTVEAVTTRTNGFITITGIRTGDSTVTSVIYNLGSIDAAARCDRLALRALEDPARLQLAIVDPGQTSGGCRLRVRTP